MDNIIQCKKGYDHFLIKQKNNIKDVSQHLLWE